MKYSNGNILKIDGEFYRVVGAIEFRNVSDNCNWVEYKIVSTVNGMTKWLSCDDAYHEYSISEMNYEATISGYHEVDRGEAVVVSYWGQVDVDRGERVRFTEFEDITEEKIMSIENWDGELEKSTGYYLDDYEIELFESSSDTVDLADGSSGFSTPYYTGNAGYKKKSGINSFGIIAVILVFICSGIGGLAQSVSSKEVSIAEYLSETSAFTYETSITGSGSEKADVYSTTYTVDQAAKNIIDGINGNTESVQQNTEDDDNSVAILTDTEYCIVYTSEDSKTLVQISTRKYTYSSDRDLYRSRYGSNRYYRRYYYSKGYTYDRSSYSSNESPYSDYSDTTVSTNYNDTYSSYSSSVRQSSNSSRWSSGGGTNSGK